MSIQRAEREYNQIILNARRELSGANGELRAVYIRIYEATAEALLRIDADLGAGRITDARASVLRRNLITMVDSLGIEAKEIIGGSMDRGIRLIENSHTEGMQRVASVLGVERSLPPVRGVRDTALSQYLVRRGLAPQYNYRTLIDLDIADLKTAVERTISSGIARGISADRLTKELALTMSQNDPEFNAVLRELGPRGGRMLKSMKEIDQADIVKAKSFLKSARRIAVTEVGNAYFEANRVASVQSEVISYVHWEVSGRHYGLPTTPDSCTYNHEADQFGLGEGMFYPQTVPPLQHPYCGCYTTNKIRDPEQWGEPKPEPDPPRTVDERGLRRFYKDQSTAHRERNVKRTNDLNRLAYKAWKGEI